MKYLGHFSNAFKFAFKSVTTVFTLLFVGSLFINATLLFWQAGALAIGKALEAGTGIVSVVTGLEALSSALELKNNELKKKNGKLEKKNKKLNTKNRELDTKNRKLKTKNEKLIAKGSRLIDRIARRTARVAKANALSVPLEAVPYFGIATIVSVTTLELYAACKTMEDTEELNRLIGNKTKIADTGEVCGLGISTQKELFEEMKKNFDPIWEWLRR